MTDALHDKLADALRDVSPHAPWVLSGKILEALAAYWAAKKVSMCRSCAQYNVSCPIEPTSPVHECGQYVAKKEPAKRVKLPPIKITCEVGDQYTYGKIDQRKTDIDALKAQGLECEP